MGQLHERLKWDTASGQILDADRRYIMMRADVLMGLFTALPAADRQRALESLRSSVRDQGGASARAYRASGAGDTDAFLQVMAESAADLGWGVWRFDGSPAGTLILTVHNSPFASAAGSNEAPVCHAIAGMLEAVTALVFGTPADVHETQCACMGTAYCVFQAQVD
ncbi:V4R domain-containing protein [Bordetella muralis]|jgi:uncharacterized protein|uniref:V4R domain-containing protein n=1 Tax=Bordetella muralis TaxID=1649130 RepID=UPI0039EEE33E